MVTLQGMSIELEPRGTQTRVKHEILARYLPAWGGIITNGLRRRAVSLGDRFQARFIYVDGFSYVGRYLPDRDSSLPYEVGSPVIGIRALDNIIGSANNRRGVPASGITILFEEDRVRCRELVKNLNDEGYPERIRENAKFESLVSGDIAIYHRQVQTIVDELAKISGRDTFIFCLLDPYGPTGLPFEFVREIVMTPHTDVMINWPFLDHLRKIGMITKDNPSPNERSQLDNYERMYPPPRWLRVIEAAQSSNDHEKILAGR